MPGLPLLHSLGPALVDEAADAFLAGLTNGR